MSRCGEKAILILLVVWAVALHVCVYSSAGALWRDEANSLFHAQLPSWSAVWGALRYDSFPMLFPALLRCWSHMPQGSGDHWLRILGLCTGLLLLLSLLASARLLRMTTPVVLLSVIAIDPILVAEGDGVRPYGWSLIGLLWAFSLTGRYLCDPAAVGVLTAATAASILAVQASYTNFIFIGCIAVSAAIVAAHRGQRREIWRLFIPGAAAALTICPYHSTLATAREWASILHSRIEWPAFLRRYVDLHSYSSVVLWFGFAALAAYALLRGRDSERATQSPPHVVISFALWTAFLGLLGQIVFVEISGVQPFPRYFLASAMLGALALEAVVSRSRIPRRGLAALVALALSAWPAWNWARQRHTNADQVGEVLSRNAESRDLIIVSPWFLHPSFQRYYRGTASWTTAPILDHYPMMRYDLIRESILSDDRGNALEARIDETLGRGGAIWLVGQRRWSRFDRADPPAFSASSRTPTGADYSQFRSYWERWVEYKVHSCCDWVEAAGVGHRRIREEEDLILSKWEPRHAESRAPRDSAKVSPRHPGLTGGTGPAPGTETYITQSREKSGLDAK